MKVHDAQRTAILNNIPDQAWLKDAESRYLAVNEAYMEACGLPEEEIIGRLPAEVWPETVAHKYLDTDQRVIATERRLRYEEQRQDANGQLRWYDTIKSPVRDESGKVIGSAGISRDISDRKATEQELIESRAQLRELSVHLQSVREAEQTRISRELHDALGQDLTALRMGLDSGQRQLAPTQGALAARLANLRELAESMIAKTQTIAQELRPAMLDDLGLEAAVESQLEMFAERTGLVVKADITITDNGYDDDLRTAVFRILQEALTNASRHAETHDVMVELFEADGCIHLLVADDGKGMGDADSGRKTRSLGLLGMHERANNVGGTLAISSEPGRGTRITLSIPLDRARTGGSKDD